MFPIATTRIVPLHVGKSRTMKKAIIDYVENPKHRGKSYGKWPGSKPPSHRDRLRMAIDAALAQKPADLDALLKLLGEAGIEVSPRGKSIRLRAPVQKNFVRLDGDSLGAEYDISALLAVLAGERTHIPGQKMSTAQIRRR